MGMQHVCFMGMQRMCFPLLACDFTCSDVVEICRHVVGNFMVMMKNELCFSLDNSLGERLHGCMGCGGSDED